MSGSRAKMLAARFANRATAAGHDMSAVDADDADLGGAVAASSSTREHYLSSAERRGASAKKRAAPTTLRRRGPLSEQLSSGKYAAVPRTNSTHDNDDAANMHLDSVDDIFGLFDEPSDGEGEDGYQGVKSEEEMAELLERRMRERGPKKARKLDDQSDRRERAKLERKLKLQQRKEKKEDAAKRKEMKNKKAVDEDEDAEGDLQSDEEDENDLIDQIDEEEDDDDDDDEQEEEDLTDEALAARAQKDADRDILGQVAALRKRLAEEKTAPTTTSGATMNVLDDDADASDAASISAAARHLGRSFSALLHTRLKLQPLVTAAVRLPQYYAMPAFLQNSNSSLSSSRSALLTELRSTLLDMIDVSSNSGGDSTTSAERRQIREQQLQRGDIDAVYTSFTRAGGSDAQARKRIDECVESIGQRVVLGPSAQRNKQDHATQTPLLEQIQGVMSGLTRLYNRAQRNRAHCTVLGHPGHAAGSASTSRKLLIAQGDIDPEIFDDSDFARELIQRSAASMKAFGSSDASTVDAQQQQMLLQMPKTKDAATSRVAFHRKTKGRSINYEPRPKLVGFMMPLPYDVSDSHREAIFRSVFS